MLDVGGKMSLIWLLNILLGVLNLNSLLLLKVICMKDGEMWVMVCILVWVRMYVGCLVVVVLVDMVFFDGCDYWFVGDWVDGDLIGEVEDFFDEFGGDDVLWGFDGVYVFVFYGD